MSHQNSPNPDQSMRDFLRQHSPTPPAAAPALEDQLMAAIEALPPSASAISPSPLSRFSQLRILKILKRWWIVPTALAATIALAWTGTWMGNWTVQTARQSTPPSLSEAELQELEIFLEETWGLVSYEDRTITAWVENLDSDPL